MDGSDFRILAITAENCQLIDNFVSKEDIKQIRHEKLFAIAGVCDDVISGVLLYEIREDEGEASILIQGIAVASDVDKKEMEDRLIYRITEDAKDEDAVVISTFPEGSEREEIFQKYGYSIEESEMADITVTYEDIRNSYYYSITKVGKHICGPDAIKKSDFNLFIVTHSQQDPRFEFLYRTNKLIRLAIMEGKIIGCVFGELYHDGNCSIDYAYIEPAHRQLLLALLKAYFDDVSDIVETENYEVHITATNQNTISLVEMLLDETGKIVKRKTAILEE